VRAQPRTKTCSRDSPGARRGSASRSSRLAPGYRSSASRSRRPLRFGQFAITHGNFYESRERTPTTATGILTRTLLDRKILGLWPANYNCPVMFTSETAKAR
jgi:hypothetical protein